MIADLVAKNRSFRRFQQSPAVSRKDLEALVDLARQGSSGGNLQPLRYCLVADPAKNDAVCGCLRWGGYIQGWAGPVAGERPTGYIVVLRDNEITSNFLIDHGVAAETIRLAAIEKGFGSCILGSIDRPKLRAALEIQGKYEILIVIALGVPGEKIELAQAADTRSIKYWRDDKGVMHVPKLALKDVLIN
jgi:nitroreductase